MRRFGAMLAMASLIIYTILVAPVALGAWAWHGAARLLGLGHAIEADARLAKMYPGD